MILYSGHCVYLLFVSFNIVIISFIHIFIIIYTVYNFIITIINYDTILFQLNFKLKGNSADVTHETLFPYHMGYTCHSDDISLAWAVRYFTFKLRGLCYYLEVESAIKIVFLDLGPYQFIKEIFNHSCINFNTNYLLFRK